MTSTPLPSSSSQAGRRWFLHASAAAVASFLAACASRQPAPSSPAQAAQQRLAAAQHLYRLNQHRIYHGMLPPMLYAIGVLEVDLHANGQVRRLNWLRAPKHAPEVIREIERTVRAAAPFPVSARTQGRIHFTDTWLWDKSGRFQLDTLSEGQIGQ